MIFFYNTMTGEKLTGVSLDGYFPGELQAIKELLAYENGISVSNIEIFVMEV